MRISDWSSDVCSSDLHFPAGVIDDAFPIFLGESTTLRCRKNIEDCFRGAAELYAERRNHQRPVDEDREFHHRIDQGLVAKTFIAKPEVRVGRALLPTQRTRRVGRSLGQGGVSTCRFRGSPYKYKKKYKKKK